MNLKACIFSDFHLNTTYSVLTARNTYVIYKYFQLLDAHQLGKLNNLQFDCFIKSVTTLSDEQAERVMRMLDYSSTGFIDFNAFYPFICLLVAIKDRVEKQFIVRHSKFVFKMIDEDDGGKISAREFENYGFIFNLRDQSVREIFFEFDVSGDYELNYREFKMFTMACIDRQQDQDKMQNKNPLDVSKH